MLELLVDAVKGVELCHEDVGAADWLSGPFVDGTTMARQIDAVAVVLGVGMDVDAPADANRLDLVGYDAGFAEDTG